MRRNCFKRLNKRSTRLRARRRRVEPGPASLPRLGRDHRPDAARAKVLARGAARKGRVAHHTPGPQARAPAALAPDRARIQKVRKRNAVVALAAGQVEGDGLAIAFGSDVDLG